jgi:hypothetical protein
MSKHKFEQLSEDERRLLVSLSASSLMDDLGVSKSVEHIIDEKLNAFLDLAISKHGISLETLRRKGSKAILGRYRDEFSYVSGLLLDYLGGVLKRFLETGEIPAE